MGKKPSLKGKGADLFFGDKKNNKEIDKDSSKEIHSVKATFYLTDKENLLLEEMKFKRLIKGIKADKSALVREAINLLAEQELNG